MAGRVDYRGFRWTPRPRPTRSPPCGSPWGLVPIPTLPPQVSWSPTGPTTSFRPGLLKPWKPGPRSWLSGLAAWVSPDGVSDLPSVEVTDEALGDVVRQLDPDTAWSFARLDMLPALGAMAARWPDLPEIQGAPGHRYTADGLTVLLFHLLAVGPDNGPITVYAVDIWAPEPD